MNFELVYTSAARGIVAGSKGYCTVAFTEGMPANYVRLAESLSGYVKGESSEICPVAFSHHRFVLGGQRLSVLSRVTRADYADYTGRKPTIAHHMVLERSGPMEHGSPAQAMQSPGLFISEWHDEPRLIREAKRVPIMEIDHFHADQWEKTCGDAGWAGVLAHYFHESSDKPVFIIFEPGQDLLPLIGEAQALLPPDVRWNATFNTYYSRLPQGSTCVWRCCLADSPALKEMRRTAGVLSIDLTKRLGCAPDCSPLVACAREGKRPDWPKRAAEVHIPAPPPKAMRPEPMGEAHPTAANRMAVRDGKDPARPGALPSRSVPSYPISKKRKMWPVVLATAGVTAVLIAILMGGLFLATRKPDAQVTTPPSFEPTFLEEENQQAAEVAIPQSVESGAAAAGQEERGPSTTEEVAAGVPPAEERKADPEAPAMPPPEPEWLVRLAGFETGEGPWRIEVPDLQWANHEYKFHYTDPGKAIATTAQKLGDALRGEVREHVFEMALYSVAASVSSNGITFSRLGQQQPMLIFMRVERNDSGQRDRLIWLRAWEVPADDAQESANGFQMTLPQKTVQVLMGTPRKTNLVCRATFQNAIDQDIPFESELRNGKITLVLPLSADAKKDLRKRIEQPILEANHARRKEKEKAIRSPDPSLPELNALVELYLAAIDKHETTPDRKRGKDGLNALAKRVIDVRRASLKPKEDALVKTLDELAKKEHALVQNLANAADKLRLEQRIDTMNRNLEEKRKELEKHLRPLKNPQEKLAELRQPERELEEVQKKLKSPKKGEIRDQERREKDLQREVERNKPKIEKQLKEIEIIEKGLENGRIQIGDSIIKLEAEKKSAEEAKNSIGVFTELQVEIVKLKNEIRKEEEHLAIPRKKIEDLQVVLKDDGLRAFFKKAFSTTVDPLTGTEIASVAQANEVEELLKWPVPGEMDAVKVSLVPERLVFFTKGEPSETLLIVNVNRNSR